MTLADFLLARIAEDGATDMGLPHRDACRMFGGWPGDPASVIDCDCGLSDRVLAILVHGRWSFHRLAARRPAWWRAALVSSYPDAPTGDPVPRSSRRGYIYTAGGRRVPQPSRYRQATPALPEEHAGQSGMSHGFKSRYSPQIAPQVRVGF